MNSSKTLKITLAAIALLFSANASALNFVTNGSFEVPDLTTNPIRKNLGYGTRWEVFDSISSVQDYATRWLWTALHRPLTR